MSTAHDISLAPARTGAPVRRTSLRPVDAPRRRRRPRLAYAVVAVLGAALIAGAQMTLSMLSTQSSFEAAALTQENRDLRLEAQELYDEVAGLSSPQHLGAEAAELGMVIDGAPSYLRLSDGAVVGGVEPAGGSSMVDAKNDAVGNAFLSNTQAGSDAREEDEAPSDGGGEEAAPQEDASDPLPPSISDGLPSPATR